MKKKPASMRVVKPMPETAKGKTCGDCKLGCYNDDNRNYRGERFLIYCDHSEYLIRKDGTGICYRDTAACSHFEAGGKGVRK